MKRTTNERLMGPRPSDGWIKIGVGGLLIKHETFQSRGGGGGASKKKSGHTLFINFRINVPEFVKFFGNIFVNLDY